MSVSEPAHEYAKGLEDLEALKDLEELGGSKLSSPLMDSTRNLLTDLVSFRCRDGFFKIVTTKLYKGPFKITA